MENNFVGVWELIDFAFYDKENKSKFKPFGDNVRGNLIYTIDGYMSANLGSLNRKLFRNSDYRLGTNEEIIEAYNNMISYSGSYIINEDKEFIVHKINMSMFPNWIGQNVKRYFRIGKYQEFKELQIDDLNNEVNSEVNSGNRYDKKMNNNDIILELSATSILQNGELLTPKLIWKKISK